VRLVALIAAALLAGAAPAAEVPKPVSRAVEKWQDKRASELIGAKAPQTRGGDRLLALPFDSLRVPILRDRHLALR
jgi:hypothetical protein